MKRLIQIIITLLAVTVTLTSCREGMHSYYCDGQITNGKEVGEIGYKVYYKKTVKYDYSCWGTNTLTYVIGGVVGINGCTMDVDKKTGIKGYISQYDTVVSLKPFTSFNPRTSILDYSFSQKDDGVEEIFSGICK